ncbi:flagellar basal body rod protein FlgB [Bacillus weihaiensis]|uniref:flagellar basal body rod protein FlgB n=1 Tax=Bacillus weihaiensis TaxID=1547283 RepID=UPI0023526B16|nr:flagellar basal body rod protein FlgB [Bacillus weihaiensis]
MKIFSTTINSLENALTQSSAKQKVISNNIANVDTPNYKAKSIRFNHALSNELGKFDAIRTNEKHISFSNSTQTSGYQVVTKSNTNYQHNGNNVDIDQEMTEMAKNQIQYNALVERLSGKFASLKTVIKGGN